MITNRRSFRRWLLPAFLLIVLLVAGCGLTLVVAIRWSFRPSEPPAQVTDGPLPDRDIAFQVSHTHASDAGIGFVNADGSGLTLVAITDQGTTDRIDPRPFWTSDGQLPLFPGNFGRGFVGITTQGERHDYARWMSRAAPLEQPNLAVLLTAFDESRSEIALFDLETSQIIRSFVVQDDDYPSIGTSALSGSLLVYRR